MTLTRRLLLGLSTLGVLVAVVLVEALRTASDAIAVLAAVALALIAGLAVVVVRRPAVVLRADLARWIVAFAATTGDSPERIVDRSVSSYRAGLEDTGDDGT